MKSLATIFGFSLLCMALGGCVTSGAHQQTMDELERLRKTSAQTEAAFEAFKKQTEAERQQLKNEIAALNQDKAKLSSELSAEQAVGRQLEQVGTELRREREELHTQADDLRRRIETVQGELASTGRTLADAEARNSSLTTEAGRLNKLAGELETQAIRAADLDKRLSEQNQELGSLRHAAADREALAAKASATTDDLERTKQRLAALTGNLAALSDTSARTAEERDRLAAEIRKQQERLQTEESEKARLERERAEKEAEIQRLTRTREELDRAFQAEVQKGDIRIKQVRDRLTINMVDRVLFDSGQAQVKPAGLKVLKQVSDVLRTVTDKQIRIEGHTDNVPIGSKIKARFPTNWELSTARATSVVRYLIEQGGVNRGYLSAIGYADNRPVVANDSEEGRQANRRIEIVLYPKNLAEIASQIGP